MRRGALLIALGLGLLFGLLVPATASACSCALVSDRQYLAQADVAFAGTVTSVTTTDPSSPVVYTVTTFAVDTTVKGSGIPTRQVVTSQSNISCGYDFQVGGRYVVLASAAPPGQGADLLTSTCSGNRPLAAGAAVPDLSMPIPRRPYPLWWLGDDVRSGFVLDAVGVVRGRVSVRYRGCAAGGCGLVRVRTVQMCPAGLLRVPLTDVRTIRGVTSGRRGGALVLETGRQEIRILGPPALALRAVRFLRAENRPIGADDPLPRAVGDVGGRLACPVARQASRAGCPLRSGA